MLTHRQSVATSSGIRENSLRRSCNLIAIWSLESFLTKNATDDNNSDPKKIFGQVVRAALYHISFVSITFFWGIKGMQVLSPCRTVVVGDVGSSTCVPHCSTNFSCYKPWNMTMKFSKIEYLSLGSLNGTHFGWDQRMHDAWVILQGVPLY